MRDDGGGVGGEGDGGVRVCHGYRIASCHKTATKTFIFLKILFYFMLDSYLVLR